MQGPRPASTRLLIEAAASGDTAAQGFLLEKLEPLLRRSALRCLGPERFSVEGDDLLQAARLSIAQSLRSFRSRDRTSLAVWVRKVVESRFLDRERARRRSSRDPGHAMVSLCATDAPEVASAGPTPSRVVMHREEVEALERAIESVPERYRAVLKLLIECHPSPSEVARSLGKPPDAARRFVGRALGHLRKALGPGQHEK